MVNTLMTTKKKLSHQRDVKKGISNNYKKDPNWNSGAENTITERKNPLAGFSSTFEQANRESVNLKIHQLRLATLKTQKEKRMKKNDQSCEIPPAYQHVYNGGPRGKEKRKGTEIIFNEVIVENFPNLIENIHPRRLINFEQGKQKKFPTLRHSTVAPWKIQRLGSLTWLHSAENSHVISQLSFCIQRFKQMQIV